MVRVFLLATLLGVAVGAFPGYGYRPANPSVTPYQEDYAPRKPLPNAFVSNNEYEAPAQGDDGYDPAAAPQEAEPEPADNGEYQAQPSEYDAAARQQGGAPEYDQAEAPMAPRRGDPKNEDGDFDALIQKQARQHAPAQVNNKQLGSFAQTGQFVQDGANTQQLQQQMQQQLNQLKQLRAQQLQLQRLQAQQAPAANTPAPRSGDDNGPSMPTEAPSKLDLALFAVKDDIMKKSRQVEQEVGWIDQVKAITSSYADKMKRVEDNVNALRDEVKDLYSKKKQIQNLQMQKKLKERLEDATQDLSTVTKALGHVQTKEGEFERTRDNIQATIYNIRTTLQGLNGQGVAGVEDDSDEKVENDIASEVKDEKPASDEVGGWSEELKAAHVESGA